MFTNLTSLKSKKLYVASIAFAAMMGGCMANDVANGSEDGEIAGQSEELKQGTNGLPSVNGLSSVNGLNSVNGLSSVNGLKSINGLPSINGLASVNGLPSINGLTSVNGLPSINGLASVNGLPSVNGVQVAGDGSPLDAGATLPVDCGPAGVVGKDCWGTPDGLMNFKTGMLSTPGGVQTASYLVRCALAAGDSVNFVDYTGKVNHMPGELGLATGFKTGQCDATCQENISACLMAYTNAAGVHVPLVLSSSKDALGGGTLSPYTMQEGAFFGNLFLSPPKAYFCKGAGQQNIATMWYGYDSSNFTARMCPGGKSGPNCPYVDTGDCSGMPWSPQACKAASDKTMTSCTGGGKTWNYPITTYLKKS